MKTKTETMWMAWHPKYKFSPSIWSKTKKDVTQEIAQVMVKDGWVAKKVIIKFEG